MSTNFFVNLFSKFKEALYILFFTSLSSFVQPSAIQSNNALVLILSSLLKQRVPPFNNLFSLKLPKVIVFQQKITNNFIKYLACYENKVY